MLHPWQCEDSIGGVASGDIRIDGNSRCTAWCVWMDEPSEDVMRVPVPVTDADFDMHKSSFED